MTVKVINVGDIQQRSIYSLPL